MEAVKARGSSRGSPVRAPTRGVERFFGAGALDELRVELRVGWRKLGAAT